jgi:hypothetical protein
LRKDLYELEYSFDSLQQALDGDHLGLGSGDDCRMLKCGEEEIIHFGAFQLL